MGLTAQNHKERIFANPQALCSPMMANQLNEYITTTTSYSLYMIDEC